MRYDTPIWFCRTVPGPYDPETGNYGPDTPEETQAWASVMDTSTETMRLVYGALRQGSLTVHLQNHYDSPFDHIRVGQKRYAVDRRRRLRVKESFILSEVQSSGQGDSV